MRGRSDGDERGRDVVHDYVGGLPDYAALVRGLVVTVVVGVKMLRGFGCSCSARVAGVLGRVRYWMSEVGAWGEVACVGRCISAVCKCCTFSSWEISLSCA